jgi:hypothetical protein
MPPNVSDRIAHQQLTVTSFFITNNQLHLHTDNVKEENNIYIIIIIILFVCLFVFYKYKKKFKNLHKEPASVDMAMVSSIM